ncbi:MAG: tetratricopeptide repeat protein [Pirellula sp.]
MGLNDDLRMAFERIISSGDTSFDVWFRLGIVCLKQHHYAEGAIALQKATEQNPDVAEAWCNLGIAKASSGNPQSAETAFRHAVRLAPNRPDMLRNLGFVLSDLNKSDEAITTLQRAIRFEPNHAPAQQRLALLLRGKGRRDEAIEHLRSAILLAPAHPIWLCELSELLFDADEIDEAKQHLVHAQEIAPNLERVQTSLGVVLASRMEFSEAVQCFRNATRLAPNSPITWSNLGNALKSAGDVEQALMALTESARLDPNNPDTYVNLGSAFEFDRRFEEASTAYLKAIELDPNHAYAHHNYALTCLRAKQWEVGWQEYEWRWKCREFRPRGFTHPVWDGSSLAGKTILLHSEQGIGDTIQFARYAPLVRRLGCRVLMECPPILVPILARCDGIDEVIPIGTPLPKFDVYAPLMSLPRILKTTAASIPRNIPYLNPDSEKVEMWRGELQKISGFKVGIVWRGNPKFKLNHHRSMPLKELAPLANLPGVQCISLQKDSEDEIARCGFPVVDFGQSLDPGKAAFVDTAAIMKSLDLVISVCSAPAHVAGALGVPVWVPLGYAPDWRWMDDESDTPWYPSMQLFRQSTRSVWTDVVARMVTKLQSLQ